MTITSVPPVRGGIDGLNVGSDDGRLDGLEVTIDGAKDGMSEGIAEGGEDIDGATVVGYAVMVGCIVGSGRLMTRDAGNASDTLSPSSRICCATWTRFRLTYCWKRRGNLVTLVKLEV